MNGARFGTDYYTRTAVAKSNRRGRRAAQRLEEVHRDLPEGATAAGQGFWSLTLHIEHHFFHPNDRKRYSLGSKNKGLKPNDDGPLTLYARADPPEEGKRSNWLPAPKGEFSLNVRCYWPEATITDGNWVPPAVRGPSNPVAGHTLAGEFAGGM